MRIFYHLHTDLLVKEFIRSENNAIQLLFPYCNCVRVNNLSIWLHFYPHTYTHILRLTCLARKIVLYHSKKQSVQRTSGILSSTVRINQGQYLLNGTVYN